jgi:Uma2 family endonuclease
MTDIRRVSVAEYHRLIELGILTKDDSLELLEGFLVSKWSRTPLHDATLEKGGRSLVHLLPPGWGVRVRSVITLNDSEPEPDFAIVRGDAQSYFSRHPGPADIALAVEVADATLPGDRDDKGRIYARAGIPRYWIVNVNDQQVEEYSSPSGPGPDPKYAQRVDHRAGDSISLPLGGTAVVQVAVQDMLP